MKIKFEFRKYSMNLNLNSYQHNMKKEIKYEFRNSRFRLQLVFADYSLQTQGAPSRSNRWC